MKRTIRKIGDYIGAHKWLQYGLIWVGIFLMSALGLNDNYHTLSWANRIIPVYQHEGMTLYIGTIVLIIGIYNLFRGFYYVTGNYLFNRNWKCFLCTIIFISLLSGINPSVVQNIRAQGSGVHAIYLEREKPLSINLYTISDGMKKRYQAEGIISLKNCSNRTVGPFKITVTLKPTALHPGGTFTCEESLRLEPKESGSFNVSYEGVLENFSEEGVYQTQFYIADKDLQMTLWEENDQVTFYTD